MKDLFKEYKVGYVSLAIMREYYMDYVREMTYKNEFGRQIYTGEPQVLLHIVSLDQILEGKQFQSKPQEDRP